METKIKNLLARLAFFAEDGMAEYGIVAMAKDAEALLKEMCRAQPEQAQQAEPVAWQLFKQALFVGMERACIHYLMANAHGRRDGALKARNHEELCKHIVAAVRGCDPDLVRRQHEDDYQAVHDGTQALTSYLDEVIGFPLDSRPDYNDLTPKFFDKFFELAMASLGVSPVAQPPAVAVAVPDAWCTGDACTGSGHTDALKLLQYMVDRMQDDGRGFLVVNGMDGQEVVAKWLPAARAMLAAPQAAVTSVNVGNRTLVLGSGLCVEGTPDGKMKVTCQFPHAPTWLPDAMTPDMMRAVQLRSELGAYAAANLAGAYDLFAEFWRVAVEEVKKGGAKC